MIHPYVVQWLAEGCVVQALPTPRGRRNALLLNRGLVTAVLKLSEPDYQELLASGPVSTHRDEGRSGGVGDVRSDNGRGARTRTAGGQGVGVVSRGHAAVATAPAAQAPVEGRS